MNYSFLFVDGIIYNIITFYYIFVTKCVLNSLIIERGEKMSDFEKIYNENYEKVYFFLLSLTQQKDLSEELTQQTFYKAFIGIGKFKNNSKLIVWLCQIAKNEYFTYLRKQKKYTYEDKINQIEDKNIDIINELLLNEKRIELHKILHSLDDIYKEVFMLRVFSDLSYKDIGNIFSKNESWVRVMFFRAKQKIIELYEEDNK